jgi:Protoglobin
MSETQTIEKPRFVADHIPGYEYGSPNAAKSPISVDELELLKQSAGFTADDERWLRMAGDVLTDQTKNLIEKWRAAIAARPHLARYSLRPDGQKDPRYADASGLRFQQWVLDTCRRPYDQDWLNDQQEMALRHSVKKNKTDGVESAPAIQLRHVIAFNAVLSDPAIIKPFLAARGHSASNIEKMHQAWSKSLWLQAALWAEPYTNSQLAPDEW